MPNPPKSQSDAAVFLLVNCLTSDDGCWTCHLATNAKGYSNLSIGGRGGIKVRAHRLIYAECVGPIPDGLMVLHSCDNRRCINPTHLRLGTAKDNTTDMMLKGRNKHNVPNRIVTHEVWAKMHQLYEEGHNLFQIAHKIGVCYETVRLYIYGGKRVYTPNI